MVSSVSSMKDDAERRGGTAKEKAQLPFVKEEILKGGCSLRVAY